MAGTIFFFTGDNEFAIRHERLRWIDEFASKHGADNIIRIDGGGLTLPQILDEAACGPFLSAKRLVVIDGIPKLSAEDIDVLVRSAHPDTLVLFTHRKMPGRRLSLPKTLPDGCTLKTFAELKSRELKTWVQDWARQNGATLSDDAYAELLSCVGEDQESLAGEVVKLASAASGADITIERVRTLAVPSSEGVVWRLTDDLCAGRRDRALTYARQLQERGGDAFGIWAVLLGMLKNLVVVAAATREGKDQKEISQQFGIHPFALRSLMAAAKRADLPRLRAFLDQAVDDDIALKTGGYRASDESPQELQAVIDRFIVTCP